MFLEKKSFYLNLKKCDFCMENIVFLGYVVSEKDIVKAIKEWPTPKMVSELRSFHRLTSFHIWM